MKRKALFNLLPILSLALALTALLTDLPGVVGAQRPEPSGGVSAQDIGTAFTYQGRLADGDDPANGTYDFRFIVYSAAIGGSQVGNIATKEDVNVTDGFFTVELDCGSGVFTGEGRYLEIGVRPGDSIGNFTTLAPRQPLKPAPYALYAQDIPLAGTGTATTAARSDHNHDGTYAPANLVPSSAVMFFNLATCPSGWHELTNARGRYLVGLPVGGTLGATIGTALSNSENRPVGRHTHSYYDPGHRHYILFVLSSGANWGDRNGGPYYVSSTIGRYTEYSGTGIAINNTGSVDGTNAPYVQLLACEKD